MAPLVRGEATGCDDFPEIGVSEYILILQWRQSGSGWERRAGLEQQGVEPAASRRIAGSTQFPRDAIIAAARECLKANTASECDASTQTPSTREY